MENLRCMGTSKSVELLLDFNKIMAKQPTRKLILFNNNLGFKNSLHSAFTKHRRTSSGTVNKIVPKNSSASFVFINDTTNKARRASSHVISILIPYLPFFVIPGLSFPSRAVVLVVVVTALFLKLLRIPRYRKWVKNRFRGTKCEKDKPKEIINKPQKRTSAADLFGNLDATSFENFVYSMCVLLAWWVISRLVSFVRRLCSKDARK